MIPVPSVARLLRDGAIKRFCLPGTPCPSCGDVTFDQHPSAQKWQCVRCNRVMSENERQELLLYAQNNGAFADYVKKLEGGP